MQVKEQIQISSLWWYSILFLCLSGCYHQSPQLTDAPQEDTPPKKESIQPTQKDEIIDLGQIQWTTKKQAPKNSQLTQAQSASMEEFNNHILSIPPKALTQLANAFHPEANGPIVMIQYGDSHTEAGFFTKSFRNQIGKSQPLFQTQVVPVFSPGFIQSQKPSPWHAKVEMNGQWQRQNFLYPQDLPPYGPMGIAFHTQSVNAKATVILKDEHIQYAQIKVLIAKKWPRLSFVLKTNKRQIMQVPAELENPQNLPTKLPSSDIPSGIPQNLTQFYDEYTVYIRQDEQLILETLSSTTAQKTGKKLDSSVASNAAKKKQKIKQVNQENQDDLPSDSLDETDRDEWLSNENLGSLVVLGFQITYPNAIAEADVFGVRSTSVDSLLRADDSTLNYLKNRNPDLVLFWYGTNSVANEQLDIDQYGKKYREMLRRFKQASPQSSCIAVGPPDFGRRNPTCMLNPAQRKAYLKNPKSERTKSLLANHRKSRVCHPQSFMKPPKQHTDHIKNLHAKNTDPPEIEASANQCRFRPPKPLESVNALQKQIALEEGCAYYDTIQAMGGIGSITYWACMPTPLASLDLVHLTPQGYEILGTHLAQWIQYYFKQIPNEPKSLNTLLLENQNL